MTIALLVLVRRLVHAWDGTKPPSPCGSEFHNIVFVSSKEYRDIEGQLNGCTFLTGWTA